MADILKSTSSVHIVEIILSDFFVHFSNHIKF